MPFFLQRLFHRSNIVSFQMGRNGESQVLPRPVGQRPLPGHARRWSRMWKNRPGENVIKLFSGVIYEIL